MSVHSLIQARHLKRQAYVIISEWLRASQDKDCNAVKALTKDLKRQVKVDKTNWLKDLASSSTWGDIRKLRRPRKPAQGRLTISSGTLVDSDERANMLATYLQNVQWAVRPCTLIRGRSPLWDNLILECGSITPSEIKQVINKSKYKKASGPDLITAEHFESFGQYSRRSQFVGRHLQHLMVIK